MEPDQLQWGERHVPPAKLRDEDMVNTALDSPSMGKGGDQRQEAALTLAEVLLG